MFNKQQNTKKNKNTIFVSSKLSTNKIKSHITVSNNLKKYFNNYNFFANYDEDIIKNNSIINIPILSRILPLAWITGSDVYVDELDETYAKSMNLLQQEYKKMYPKAPFQTKIIVKKLIKNKSAPKKTALLFSGGLDSTYSLYKNIQLNPRLIMIFGAADIAISNKTFQEILKKEFTNIANQEKLKINYIRTNIMEILNTKKINHLWRKFQGKHEGGFWNGMGFSLGQIGLTAPLSVGRFSNILFSSFGPDRTNSPLASLPNTDEKIRWANLKVTYFGIKHRHDKMLFLKKYMFKHRIKLKVCSWHHILVRNGIINCSKCEKCLRTIITLVLSGLNPNNHGFYFDDSTLKLIRFSLKEKVITKRIMKVFWKPLQQIIPEKIENDFYGSKQFLEWFKHFNLDLAIKKQDKIANMYSQLPNPFKYFLEISRIYNFFSWIRKILFSEEIPMYAPIEITRK